MTTEELNIVKLISISGDSKAKAFEALKCVKTKEFDRARELIKESRSLDLEAHNIQTELISKELNEDEESSEIGLLMVHAQDHYMTSQLARDLIETLITVFE
ncbi:PTS lactose/cellobiose transporter subunit IIA [Enterococcus sp. HY326]|uniref:PTS lactose/cellobiose transporter subunit IIA n=1 Tax=Enterococcus sp. HY326 TaxID=2971265 RepID=UPI00223F0A75|nr:PTS lactose/cellobiose transporter subunit IIA [Enterococcus sp. HY326]